LLQKQGVFGQFCGRREHVFCPRIENILTTTATIIIMIIIINNDSDR
jgi:hypothetical protein